MSILSSEHERYFDYGITFTSHWTSSPVFPFSSFSQTRVWAVREAHLPSSKMYLFVGPLSILLAALVAFHLFSWREGSEANESNTVLGTGEMFDGIAHYYDFMNSVMSLSLHKQWKRGLFPFLALISPNDNKPMMSFSLLSPFFLFSLLSPLFSLLSPFSSLLSPVLSPVLSPLSGS